MSPCDKALNRLAKWRTVFAGWQLGTRPKGEPESDAVRDHREATLLLRVEATAVLGILLEKGVCSREEFEQAVAVEADHLSRALERRFPGFKATDDGIEMDRRAADTTKGWRP